MHAHAVAAVLQRCKAPVTARGRARRAYVVLITLIGLSAVTHGASAHALGLLAAFWQVYGPLADPKAATGQPGASALWTRGAWQEVAAALIVAALTLPPWAAAAWGWLGPLPGAAHSQWGLTFWGGVGAALLRQVAQGAAAEEWFWRGYVQLALGGDRRAMAEAAAAFALAHVAFSGSLLGAATFVPGMIFGALVRRRGRLLGATLLHATYNVVSALMLGEH